MMLTKICEKNQNLSVEMWFNFNLSLSKLAPIHIQEKIANSAGKALFLVSFPLKLLLARFIEFVSSCLRIVFLTLGCADVLNYQRDILLLFYTKDKTFSVNLKNYIFKNEDLITRHCLK